MKQIQTLSLAILFALCASVQAGECQGRTGASAAALTRTSRPTFVSTKTETDNSSIETKSWGKTADGQQAFLYTLTNKKTGMTMSCTNRGATIVSLTSADKNGKQENVVVGYDAIEKYDADTPFFGAFIGRYGNRIANGQFAIDGVTYKLVINEPAHNVTLHGGAVGFDKRVLDAKAKDTPNGPAITFTIVSADGDQGFPGTLTASVTYTLSNDNELICHYAATTDKPTVCNLTQHTYFNLGAGDLSKENLNDSIELQIVADNYNPVDKNLIPTAIAPVAGTPFDFRASKPIGKDHNVSCEQFTFTGGYDHNWVLNKQKPGELTLAAVAKDPVSGRVMEVFTTEPGIQFYAGVALSGKNIVNGKPVAKRSAFCLETQHYPDSPNQKDFPSTVLRPGEKYDSTTIYKFSVEK